MPEDKKVATEKAKKEAPVVRVRSRGQISGTLERFAAMYEQRYPEKATRYVYDPSHKPELSGVMGRQAMGYEVVTWGEIGIVGDDRRKEEDPVRVGDLVLMGVDKEIKEKLRAERRQWAKDQTESVQRKFYEEIEKEAESKTPGHHRSPVARPLGRAVIEERDFEYDIQQREE